MRISLRAAVDSVVAVAAALAASAALAHSVSDAYLTFDAAGYSDGATVMRGQWDIALRDLDFAIGLDANGDGNITWRELRVRQEAVARYAYRFLTASADGKPCTVRPARQQVASHADGAYVALAFDIVCTGAPAKVTIDYRAFFALDPSHRCILVSRKGGEVATALLSPQRNSLDLRIWRRTPARLTRRQGQRQRCSTVHIEPGAAAGMPCPITPRRDRISVCPTSPEPMTRYQYQLSGGVEGA